MLDLIIKNGECYIDGKIIKTNIEFKMERSQQLVN